MPPAKKAASKTVPTRRGASRNATDAAVTKFEEEFAKTFGAGALTKKQPKVEIHTTGSMLLDFALTIGGIPAGRVIEVWGPEHAGKTTAAMIQCAILQKKYPNKKVAWVDMEQTFDDEWAGKLGLDRSKMWFYTPQTAEDVSDAVKKFVLSGMCSIVVLDSIGGMISRMEAEKDADESTVGQVPKIVTRMVKLASPAAFRNGTDLYVINQVRANIGSYGPDEDTGGGWALKHVTTIKMQVRRMGGQGTTHSVKVPGHEQPVPVGHKIAVRIQKNKMGPYGTVAEVWLHNRETEQYGPVGFDPLAEVFSMAKRFKFMGSGAGGNYEIDEVKIKGGEDAVMDYLRLNPEVVETLRQQVLDTVKGKVMEDTEPDIADEDPYGIADLVDAK